MAKPEIERSILQLLKATGCQQIGYFIIGDASALQRLIKQMVGVDHHEEWADFAEAFWALLARRLIFVGGARSINECTVWLTERGKKAASGEEFNPRRFNALHAAFA